MSRNQSRIHGVALVAGAALALSACEVPPKTVTDLTESEPVLKVVMATSAEARFPSGSSDLSETVISGFDTSVPDAWGRSTSAADEFVVRSGGGFSGFAFPVAEGFRNSSQDERLPALVESDAAVGGWYAIWEPGFGGVGAGAWNLWGEVTGLAPDTEYTVVLARMAIDVNGSLDQNEVLTGRSPNAPDELEFLGGAPAGINPPKADFPAPFPITGDNNPVAVCWDATDGDGNVELDCMPQAVGNSPWWRNTDATFQADSLPFGDNTGSASLEEGQYNYLLIYEGRGTAAAPIPAGNPTVRIQVGPDIDTNGNVINNGFKPFPTAVADDPTSLPGGAESFPAPGKVELEMTGLATLGGMQYTLWLYDRSSGSYTLAEGSEISIDGGAATTGATFDSPGASSTISVNLAPGTDFGAATHVVVSMESAAGGTPSQTKFLFKEYLTTSKALSDGPLTLGGFNGGTGDYVFTNAGSGTAEFIVLDTGRRLRADLRRLPQPPQGFHYASYLVELIPSTPVSQFVRANDITLDALGNAQDLIEESQVGNFAMFNTYVAMLEPNGLSVLTPHFVQVSDNYQFKFVDFFPR